MKKLRKNPITLLEIMIVIFIIGIIGGVIGYNMKGSLDEGRAFKCQQGSRQVYDILTLKMADGTPRDIILENPQAVLDENGFVNNPKKLLKDGWGQDFEFRKLDNEEFIVYSDKWYHYLRSKKKMTDQDMQEEYPWAFNFDHEA